MWPISPDTQMYTTFEVNKIFYLKEIEFYSARTLWMCHLHYLCISTNFFKQMQPW